jgi:hypothetical protein
MSRSVVLSGYRSLSRAGAKLFTGDPYALRAFQNQLRNEFAKGPKVEPHGLEKWNAEVSEVLTMMKYNVLPSKRNERGNFGAHAAHARTSYLLRTAHL